MLTDSSAKLAFSTDSVLFDTVFHYAGSVTKMFRIYNKHSQPMTISKIYLASGTSSNFKLNVDGFATTSSAPVISNVEILGGDSLYGFVQVNVTPTVSNPILIKDSIIFETNGNIQDINLTAIGQDVYLHKPDPGKFYSIIGRSGHDTILPNDKPHLVFGYVVVDSACKVTLQAGTHFYMHNHSVFWVYKDGTVDMQGGYGNEVTFQGDRLDPDYKEIPGQWGKIWLSALSKDNKINYAIIKNAGIGVQADTLNGTLATATSPTLIITNTIIKNMTAAAIYAQGSFVRGVNCVFANCGQYVAALTIGGRYSFLQCTFADYWTGTPARTSPVLAMNNFYTSTGGTTFVRSLDSAYFGNCIIYGDQTDEVQFDTLSAAGPGYFSYKFDHCLLKTTLNIGDAFHYNTPYVNVDPGFKDQSNNDYRLHDASSFPIDKGSTSIVISTDLTGFSRTAVPDLGAYEFH
ncbi:MAG: hypothetical protein ACXVPU_12175 [Bacteroidia bacterium]